MHAKRSVCSEDVGVAAPSATAPHLQGACLPLAFDHEHDQCENQMNLMRSTSVSNLSNSRADSDAPLIDFSVAPTSQLRVGATPLLNENAMSMNPAPAQACAAQVVGQSTCNFVCGSAFNSQIQSNTNEFQSTSNHELE